MIRTFDYSELLLLINFGEAKYEDFPELQTATEKGYEMNAFSPFFFNDQKNFPLRLSRYEMMQIKDF